MGSDLCARDQNEAHRQAIHIRPARNGSIGTNYAVEWLVTKDLHGRRMKSRLALFARSALDIAVQLSVTTSAVLPLELTAICYSAE